VTFQRMTPWRGLASRIRLATLACILHSPVVSGRGGSEPTADRIRLSRPAAKGRMGRMGARSHCDVPDTATTDLQSYYIFHGDVIWK
jgi:hypothetical protein